MKRFLMTRKLKRFQSYCDDWNESHPLGTLVEVKTRTGIVRTRTNGRASTCNGQPWLHVNGLGRVSLYKVTAIKED